MANEKRLIDANAFEVVALNGVSEEFAEGAKFILEKIDAAPTVDTVEVVHGRWLMDKLEIGNPYDGNSTMIADIGNCSVCGYRCEMLPVMNYCPNCGAKMDGDGDA